MKRCGRCRKEKALCEFSRNKRNADGLQCTCKSCCKEVNAAYYVAQKDRINERNAKWKAANPDKVLKAERARNARPEQKEKAANFREQNRERLRLVQAEWRARNPEAEKAKGAKWSANNRGTKAANLARYRAALLRRTPDWADVDLIRKVYEYCAALNTFGKAGFHVDHIYPIRGKTVSGLHVALNLQVLPGFQNMAKGNRVSSNLDKVCPCILTDEFKHWLSLENEK